MAQVRHVVAPERLEPVLQQSSPALCIVDLRARQCLDLIEKIQKEWPEILVVALGTVRSEPLREAEQSGIYAAEDLQLDRRRLQALVSRAFDYLKILQENRSLQEKRSTITSAPSRPMEAPDNTSSTSLRLMRFPRVFRRFENVDALFENLVQSIADATGVTRVGLFCRMHPRDGYRFRAGLRCLPETSDIEFDERDPIVRWLELNAHLISRASLSQTQEPEERALLRRALDSFGAEVIVPLHSRNQIIGWIFFGRRLTGQSFDNAALEELTLLGEHVSTVLENALLQEETALQKTLAETLLKSIPPGIVATDEDGTIRWFNQTAEQMLGIPMATALNKPVEAAGALLARLLRDALETKENLLPRQWIDKNTRRSILVEVRRLLDGEKPLGAVAVVQDLTAEEDLRQKQDLLERTTFWTDLAASMSHEIRNPLVAIKTFAQLLPDRFEDADFRKEFNEIVIGEVDRLDKIVTQISNFAHPPELTLKAFDVRSSVNKAVEIARSRFNVNGGIAVETSLPSDLPKVIGDEAALAEAFAHLVVNAAEAAAGESKPRITLAAKTFRQGKQDGGVVVTVRDNGKGIAPDLKDKVFSPFCTTKPRGMGLGLPIVKRTVFDHNGRVDIDSSTHGTLVSVVLPSSPGKN
jgi:nitrogen-specific signal transduction histidine kinase/GAF domain-containing protein